MTPGDVLSRIMSLTSETMGVHPRVAGTLALIFVAISVGTILRVGYFVIWADEVNGDKSNDQLASLATWWMLFSVSPGSCLPDPMRSFSSLRL